MNLYLQRNERKLEARDLRKTYVSDGVAFHAVRSLNLENLKA